MSRDRLAIAVEPARRGVRKLRTALGLLDERSESPSESQLRALLVRAGLVGFVANLPITTSDGYRYRADLAFIAEKVLVEYQGEHHFQPARIREDMTRRSRLQSDGWLVFEVSTADFRDPTELVSRIRRALATRRRH